jgi:hypothetical protein
VRYPTRADELVTLIEEHGWHLANTPATPTYHYRNGTGSSVLDLMLAAPAVAREVSNWAVDEENPSVSNHEVILFQIATLHPDAEDETPEPHLNWRKTNWDAFSSTLQELSTNNYPLWSSTRMNPTVRQLDNWASLLRDIITTAATQSTPALVLSPRSKRWWSPEVEHTRAAMTSARRRWQKMHLPHHHVDYGTLRNKHLRTIRYAKDSCARSTYHKRKELTYGPHSATPTPATRKLPHPSCHR